MSVAHQPVLSLLALLCLHVMYQEFPFGRVELVDTIRKTTDNLISSIFWVDFCLFIDPQ